MIAARPMADEAAAEAPALDVRAVDSYDEIAVRAARPRTTAWMILLLGIQFLVGVTTTLATGHHYGFFALLLGFWAFWATVLALCLVWMVVGVKRIAVINGNLWVGCKFFRWTISRAYRGSEIRGFGAAHEGHFPRGRWQRGPGIRFLCRTRSVHIGFDLEESDIDRLVALLAARLPEQVRDPTPRR